MNWPFRTKRNPAAELARMGHEQHRQRVLATARRIREEKNLPADPRLEAGR